MKPDSVGLRWLWRNRLLYGFLVLTVPFFACMGYMVARYGISLRFINEPLAGLFIAICVAYGLVRGVYYHPALSLEYQQWLAMTPWRYGYPLPRGPLHLVGTDLWVVLIGASCSFLLALTFSTHAWLYAAATVAGFTLAIALGWTLANSQVDQQWHVYGVCSVPPLFGLLQMPPVSLLVCPLLMAPIAWHGVRRSLLRFPWHSVEKITYSERIGRQGKSPFRLFDFYWQI